MMSLRERLCIALDGSDRGWILGMARELAGEVGWLKIGLEAFAAHGPALVEELSVLGPKVFLDLKLHDIPNTVRAASHNCASAGASLITVHASGGRAMLEAAVAAVSSFEARPRIVAVTVLTSLDGADLAEVGFIASVEELVRRGARLAKASGLDGVVCSAQEAESVRNVCGREFFIVTPGIRLVGACVDDQRRVVSPARALANGSHLLVIGRPVTRAAAPAEVATEILKSLELASSQ